MKRGTTPMNPAPPCACCPFRDDNDEAVLNRIRGWFPDLDMNNPDQLLACFRSEKKRADICHSTEFNDDRSPRDPSFHRPCRGPLFESNTTTP